jgi:hypothetical protein
MQSAPVRVLAFDARKPAMILRAVFWIALVALLMPRDVGRVGLALHSALGCKGDRETCLLSPKKTDSFSWLALRSLAQVKADIERDARSHRSAEIY